MRNRNIKINVFLNEEEKQLLLEKCNKARLSQSDFIRKLIVEQTINMETKYDFKNLKEQLLKLYNYLDNLCNKFYTLGYEKLVLDIIDYRSALENILADFK